ncbi:MAG: D-inositol-3-phosphate glycosyltransferase [Chlamydiales bacterium]|nr:D-inositol-3-phosphate glycosyltransferase [Chlamydiales bacterium]MCH9619610.1 D-inositol-3-phosphate glycosyltransferase [Chlamydiales bacterium]MCH9623216.1 D-inositol-3-phosphate glycosyltransferase [Chlamydiales bacterium]
MLHASGIGTYLKHLLPFLAKEFDLILLHNENDQIDSQARLIPMKSGIYTIKEQFELFLKIPKCDFFWSPHYNIPLLPIRAKKRLVTINDVYPLAFSKTLSLLQKIYAKLFFNGALLYSDLITTISSFSKQEITRLCRVKKKVHVVQLSVAIKSQHAPQEYLLAVGNIKPHKNLLRLVKAFEKMDCREKLVIVGKKEGFRTRDDPLLAYVEKNLGERVLFTGYVKDEEMPELYSKAKLFIFPSYYEGFGLPPLEAMACSCPVIAAKAASIPEVCGDAVYYVDPYSVDSIQKGMETVLQNEALRLELVDKGEKWVKKFTPETTAKRFIHLIHENCSCP